MACARDPNIQYGNSIAFASSITGNYNTVPTNKKSFNCRKIKSFYPSFVPTLLGVSRTSSASGEYSLVYISGTNFLPQCYGTTYVNFGSFTNLPITFYSSFNISFVVPLSVTPDNYDIVVVNIYNNNFSPSVNQSYPGNPNISNSITYTIT
jgi:hypothetical protein